MMSVERALAKAAAALLPGLLPTPPRSTMITPCLIILPAPSPKPGRADSVDRWDAHKKEKKPSSPASSAGSASSSSCERWDINKKKTPSSSTSSSSRSWSCERWDSNKRPPSRASSGDRWDAHKKARSAQADAESQTGQMKEQEIDCNQPPKDETRAMVPRTAPRWGPVFSGPSFVDSPDPSMLPMPTFARSHGPVPAFLRVH